MISNSYTEYGAFLENDTYYHTPLLVSQDEFEIRDYIKTWNNDKEINFPFLIIQCRNVQCFEWTTPIQDRMTERSPVGRKSTA